MSYFRTLVSPERLIAGSFICAIAIGTTLLSLPWAVHHGRLPLADAVFTATSAVCVTGLTVKDTGSDFTLFGQIVILLLLQAGGLGIITFSVFFAASVGLPVSLLQKRALQESLSGTYAKQLLALLRFTVKVTLAIEGVGALLLFLCFLPRHLPLAAAWTAIFTSISAFCNAGFSTYSDSLESFRTNIPVNLVVTLLIMTGGIGFLVLMELKEFLLSRLRTGRRTRLSLHTKLTLSATAVLVPGAALLLFIMQRGNIFAGMPVGEKLLCSYFQSVTARTAGFNTVPIASLPKDALLLLIMLMFIGASAGSTGGGIKTTSVAVLFAVAKARLMGREAVTVFRRALPEAVIIRATSVTVLAMVIIAGFTLAVCYTQSHPDDPDKDQAQFVDYLFESASAFGTVGLSTGATRTLDTEGKLLITLLMFIGRTGPLTLAVAAARRPGASDKLVPAQESVMIG